jgi:starvation-inducible DNA-binding protein
MPTSTGNNSKTRSRKGSSQAPSFTAPGVSLETGSRIAGLLQDRLNALTDLSLTLKHIHWNVVGPHFIGVHTMLDPQVDAVLEMVDQTAERIATLGVAPIGTPGALVAARSWDDYSIGRADAIAHLGALDQVYSGVVGAHRLVIDELDDLDPVTQDMVIGQVQQLELFQWFVRAHLESSGGQLSDAGEDTERGAAEQASGIGRRRG